MNLNNYTIKAQETIQAAQQLAFNNNDINIETNHLLKALLADKDSAIEYLLKKNNVNLNLPNSNRSSPESARSGISATVLGWQSQVQPGLNAW